MEQHYRRLEQKYPRLGRWLRSWPLWDKLFAWTALSWMGRVPRRRPRMFPQCLPELLPLEPRWLPSGNISEFSVPTSAAQPLNMTLGPDGNVWFTENGSGINQIAKVTPSGT